MKNTDSIMYSVIVPVYNSSATIRSLVDALSSVFKEIDCQYEFIFIDDGSKDDSWDILCSLHHEKSCIKIISLARNFGQHNAIMCGFHYAEGDYMITLDDDLQNPPDQIPRLIDKAAEGFHVVYGRPVVKQQTPFRNLASSAVQFIYRKTFQATNNISSFRLIEKTIAKEILKYDKSFVFIDGLLAWNTSDIAVVNVRHDKRVCGKTGYTFRTLLRLAMNMLTNFSVLPLRIATLLGFLFASIGLFSAAYFILTKLIWDIPVQGYASIITAITILSGVQLLMLGIIGEYLGRIFLSVNIKPQYNVAKQKIKNE